MVELLLIKFNSYNSSSGELRQPNKKISAPLYGYVRESHTLWICANVCIEVENTLFETHSPLPVPFIPASSSSVSCLVGKDLYSVVSFMAYPTSVEWGAPTSMAG